MSGGPGGLPCCCIITPSCLTLWPHGLQHARLLCPSPSPRVCSNSCPLSRWCHPTISSSVVPFSHLPSFPASRSLLMSGLPWWLSGEESAYQCRRPGFDPWVGMILWTRASQPTPVFLPGAFHGQRSLAGCNPWDHKKSDMTERLTFQAQNPLICRQQHQD